jgi:hypothetical protein
MIAPLAILKPQFSDCVSLGTEAPLHHSLTGQAAQGIVDAQHFDVIAAVFPPGMAFVDELAGHGSLKAINRGSTARDENERSGAFHRKVRLLDGEPTVKAEEMGTTRELLSGVSVHRAERTDQVTKLCHLLVDPLQAGRLK